MRRQNVLSLFDGMACCYEAMKRAGIPVGTYYASEIEKEPIKVAMKNHPDIIQMGDVIQWKTWKINWKSIDYLTAGSPCQGFSLAGKQRAFNDDRSKLFFTFIDILNHIRKFNPNVKFLLENVNMKQEFLDVITYYTGVEPIKINSSLVSAQNRPRWYWTNVPNVSQPEDRGITLGMIIPGAVGIGKHGKKMKGDNFHTTIYIRNTKGKAYCLTTRPHTTSLYEKDGKIHKLTVREAELIQTLSEGYTDVPGICNGKRFKMIGNGWTINVIETIFSQLINTPK